MIDTQPRHPEALEGFSARVLTDSVSPAGIRLTTLEVRFPRFILSEFNTHRVMSKNSASSRAVPTNKMIQRVLENPATPVEWGVNKPGMSASEAITDEQAEEAKAGWLRARDSAVQHVRNLQQFNIHKQVVNRLLEPFMWHTVIVTATEWDNFFKLRLAENAQPEIRVAAQLMREAMDSSLPSPVAVGEWHLPLIQDDERSLPIETQKMVSAARCARVSYLTHDGKRDIDKDIELCERLRGDRHLSPFEHVATPKNDAKFAANFRGWVQLRKEIEKIAL
jgi:thymidylate synthase ThyX